jgi:hypothetical protein
MPHMLAQEHMGYVDALRYGTARTDVTIAAALSAIGATSTVLVLTQAGDGIWTIGSNITIPANVTLLIPAGTTINVASGRTFTVSGPIDSYNLNWRAGTGTFVFNAALSATHFFGQLSAQMLNIANPQYSVGSFPSLTVGGSVQSQAGAQPTLQVYPYVNATDGPAIDFVAGAASPTNTWRISRGTHGGGSAYLDIYNTTIGQGTVILGGLGVGLGNILPTHVLHMGVDDAFKATTLWTVPSDSRLKTILGDFQEGLPELVALPRIVRFTWNGLAQTPTDGREQIGWIAQEAAPINPALFTTYEDRLNPTDEATTTLYTANYSPVLFMLVNAVKTLSAQVEALTARVAALETP